MSPEKAQRRAQRPTQGPPGGRPMGGATMPNMRTCGIGTPTHPQSPRSQNPPPSALLHCGTRCAQPRPRWMRCWPSTAWWRIPCWSPWGSVVRPSTPPPRPGSRCRMRNASHSPAVSSSGGPWSSCQRSSMCRGCGSVRAQTPSWGPSSRPWATPFSPATSSSTPPSRTLRKGTAGTSLRRSWTRLRSCSWPNFSSWPLLATPRPSPPGTWTWFSLWKRTISPPSLWTSRWMSTTRHSSGASLPTTGGRT
mmetsp:Transcript_92941/g.161059  ORF Transcript_92941/g.161059 Transcript_92941/m.161059 type:complete len:250 (+) Transcript_92941:444-1193(+)